NDKLYCGIAKDVDKRFSEHLEGVGAKYTRANKPKEIVYRREFETKSEALREELRIKSLSRKEKLGLIAGL
ncbi:putative endonuclease, partial [Candidatus Gastranaerophilus sp. (ex Termes propinquus)]